MNYAEKKVEMVVGSCLSTEQFYDNFVQIPKDPELLSRMNGF